jgi:hypothetical protein
MEDKKVISFTLNPDTLSSSKKVKAKKDPRKRVEPQKWKNPIDFQEILLKQSSLIQEIKENNFVGFSYETKLICQQIERKIAGYKQQDIHKGLLCPEKLVTLPSIINSFLLVDFCCFYCKEKMLVLYEMVRENNQWTVDRVNNDLGHNTDNYVLACLGCNLKRRCRTKEQYLFTKQLVIKKIG